MNGRVYPREEREVFRLCFSELNVGVSRRERGRLFQEVDLEMEKGRQQKEESLVWGMLRHRVLDEERSVRAGV